MPPWLLPALVALWGIVSGIIGYFLRQAHQEIRTAHGELRELGEQLRSLHQEIYGANRDNGLKQMSKDNENELAYQSASIHWVANMIVAIADKAGVVVRSDRPKRTDFR